VSEFDIACGIGYGIDFFVFEFCNAELILYWEKLKITGYIVMD
jgi:hypothetical protein